MRNNNIGSTTAATQKHNKPVANRVPNNTSQNNTVDRPTKILPFVSPNKKARNKLPVAFLSPRTLCAYTVPYLLSQQNKKSIPPDRLSPTITIFKTKQKQPKKY